MNKLAVPIPLFWKTVLVSYNGAVLWNSLPSELRQVESLNKVNIHTHTYMEKKYEKKNLGT